MIYCIMGGSELRSDRAVAGTLLPHITGNYLLSTPSFLLHIILFASIRDMEGDCYGTENQRGQGPAEPDPPRGLGALLQPPSGSSQSHGDEMIGEMIGWAIGLTVFVGLPMLEWYTERKVNNGE